MRLFGLATLMLMTFGCGREAIEGERGWQIDAAGRDMDADAAELEVDQGVAPQEDMMPPPPPPAETSCRAPVVLVPEVFSAPTPWSARAEPVCNGDLRRQAHFVTQVPPMHRLNLYGDAAGVRAACGEGCLYERSGVIHDSAQPARYYIAAQRYDEQDEAAQLMARHTPLVSHGSCRAPRRLGHNEALRGEDILGGGEFYDGCGVIDEGPTLFYEVELELGVEPHALKIQAVPQDPSVGTLSLQTFLNDDPRQCSKACKDKDIAYFRGGEPAASVTVSGADGGGRSPVRVLVAVTMSAPSDPSTSTRFDLIVSPMAP